MPSKIGQAGVERETLLTYLQDYLQAEVGEDYSPNGLQVQGAAAIHKIVTGVSACQELFLRAQQARAEAILVHHGLFLHGRTQVLTGIHYQRVRQLITGDINLLAYHLPLDRHPEVGNNILAARAFGLVATEPFAEHKGLPIGFMGHFEAPLSLAELVHRTTELYGQPPLVHSAGERPIQRLGIVSGGAQREFEQAIAQGLDAYITGEVSEWVMNVAREEGVHFLAAGHYAGERLGIRQLGLHLAERFDLEVEFIDIPNPA
jgi:dinuclear metal center YbgI/SA1388 family protein